MGRAPCCDKTNVKRGPWAPEEDAKLKSYIEENGTGGNWIALPHKIGLKRCGKSCRLRWLNYLRPNIKHGSFSEEEDHIICTLYLSIGSRWSIIAAQLPGRTDNDIKNYWNTRLKKKLLGKQRKEPKRGSHGKQEITKREAIQELKAPPLCMNMNMNMMNLYPSCWPPQELPFNDHQDPIKNLLFKLGERFANDHQSLDEKITSFDQYPFDVPSTQPQLFDQNSQKPYLLNENGLNEFQEFNNYPLVGIEELVYNNTQLGHFDVLMEGFSGEDNLINGSTCTTGSSKSTTSWGDPLLCPPPPHPSMVYEDCQQGLLQNCLPQQSSPFQ